MGDEGAGGRRGEIRTEDEEEGREKKEDGRREQKWR